MTSGTEYISKAEFVEKLEALSAESKTTAQTPRKHLWEQLAKAEGKENAQMLVKELAEALAMPTITIQRWIDGEYAPRASALDKLRKHFGLATPGMGQKREAGADPPVPFGGENSYAALRTIDHFFHALEHSHCCFVFKGKLEFHAGRREKIRSQLVQILRANPNRVVYYVFRKDSEGQETFQKLKKKIEETDSDVSDQIRAVQVPGSNDQLGLGMSLASPFLVRYDANGRQKFKRVVDIWYEVPVEPLDVDNQVQDDRSLFVFVQLPVDASEDLWEKWREWLLGLHGIRKEDLEK